MELEFIDISRDEEYERPRVRSTGNRRRGARSERKIEVIPEKRRRPAGELSGNGSARRQKSTKRMREAARQAEQERIRRRKQRRRKMAVARMATWCFLVFLIAGSAFLLFRMITGLNDHSSDVVSDYLSSIQRQEVMKVNKTEKPIITEDFIPINEYSRPGEVLPEVNNLFVHYTANPRTSAAQNRSYFENIGITGERSVSAHFVIGYNGEIIQCIPLNEIAYAVKGRNYDSISIECCYLDEDGKFTADTYQALVRLSAWLLKEYDLTPQDMRRHYDEGGKKCPLYFVEHEDAWEQFIKDLEDYIMQEQA